MSARSSSRQIDGRSSANHPGDSGTASARKAHRQFECPGGGLPDSPMGPNRPRSHDKAARAPDINARRKSARPVSKDPSRRLPISPAGGWGLSLCSALKARKGLDPVLLNGTRRMLTSDAGVVIFEDQPFRCTPLRESLKRVQKTHGMMMRFIP